MDDVRKVLIEDIDGTVREVDLITYLVSDDGLNNYIVYSKGEVQAPNDDHVIYISKMVATDNGTRLLSITDNNEWMMVQRLLKNIANKE